MTDFGDAGVIIPMCAAVAGMLLVMRQARTAMAWVIAIGAVGAIILLLKFALYSFELAGYLEPLRLLSLVSPSGHVAGSSMAYGGLVSIALKWRSMWRCCGIALGIGLAIGATRVWLGDHSVAEVVVGTVVGVAGAGLFIKLAAVVVSARRRAVVLATAGLAMFAFHGIHMTGEHRIQAMSLEAFHLMDGR